MDVPPEDFEARIQQATIAFDACPPKPPKPSSPRKQVVASLFEQITRLKQIGYDFDEICQLLVEQTGVEMTSGTLRKYWGAERRQRQGKKPQPKRSRSSRRSKKQPLPVQAGEKPPVQADELDEVNQSSPEPAVAIDPVTSDDSSDTWPPVGDTWPPVDDREANSPPKSESEPEQPVENHQSDSEDYDDWGVNMNDDDDDDSYTTGLIHEPTFNRIRRS